jgi:hypothetical protein
MLSELRESFLWGKLQEYFHRSAFHIYIRYISYVFILLMLYMLYSSTKKSFLFANNPPIPVYYDILLSISLVWILSSEWINVMDLLRSDDSYRLGLSFMGHISVDSGHYWNLEK